MTRHALLRPVRWLTAINLDATEAPQEEEEQAHTGVATPLLQIAMEDFWAMVSAQRLSLAIARQTKRSIVLQGVATSLLQIAMVRGGGRPLLLATWSSR